MAAELPQDRITELMSGRRAKALKRLFISIHGRAPRRAEWYWTARYSYGKHERKVQTASGARGLLARMFAAAKRVMREKTVVGWFMANPQTRFSKCSGSEWRRFKRSWKRGEVAA